MPVNRQWNMAELKSAMLEYCAHPRREILIEYVLLKGINDSLECADLLAEYLDGLKVKVNLIPYNPVEGLPWQRPSEEVCEGFLAALEKLKVTATLRREKGMDIDAACGQLRLKTERELSEV